MSRTTLFHQVARALRLAEDCEASGAATRDALARLRTARESRRRFLKTTGVLAFAASGWHATAADVITGPRIAIVGGGLAGLVCADRLEAKGYRATIYEARARLGGRCFSNRALVPGMAAENGGEFIDTGHKTMLAYANAFGLARLRAANELLADIKAGVV